jgi:hypothetical protein
MGDKREWRWEWDARATSSSSQREGTISNPRVLSDMGLAILMKKTLKTT